VQNVVVIVACLVGGSGSPTAQGGFTLASGQIKRLVRDRGFGFIRPEGASEDIFFHSSAMQGGAVFDDLNEGQNVEFDKESDPRDSRRSRAVNIRLVN
jgi:CspA family cold shock protein